MAVMRRGVAAAVLLSARTCAAADACAQDTLRDLLRGSRGAYSQGRIQPAPPVARYVAEEDRSFILDRSGQTPLLKFEDNAEVYALRPTPGPGGDVIYKDDTGRAVARASRLGGLTVFTSDRPGGMAAALAGEASAIRPAAISPGTLLRLLAQASYRVRQAAGALIVFNAPDVTPATSWLFADAVTLTAEGFTRAARRKEGRAALRRVREVRFEVGRQPGVAVVGDRVQITVSPRHGVAGRPSSQRIANAVVSAG